MSDGSMEQVQNRVNSDLRRQFRSFRGFIKKPEKGWSAPTLKWFSLYSIGILASMWAFILDWTKLEPWIGIAITVGISMIIVVSILFIENARAASEGWSRIRRYMNALIFTVGTIAVGFAGWIGGTAMHRHLEPLASKFISP